ncbi:hypothetical protein [Asanoa siamensis]|uniref:Uncharacterized protein n=1 Tax=Asanoa siamensis TaxID=926357 RepID=A0ABQ4D2S7_9ACTN|nr:hypothetical protein [Asanoa siamensis]GIF77848.1 hypothetical protein Asi02nite_73660 [Asanoa siamensis]
MTTESVSAGDDPRRLLSDVRALARRVRLDQRVTAVALLALAAVSLLALPVDWLFLNADCGRATVESGAACHIRGFSRGFYWLPALLLAYSGIAVYAARAARARGLGARVLPYVLTGVALAVLSAAAWVWAYFYLDPPPAEPFADWVMVLDRLVGPAGTIGLALLVLAWLERHVALLAYTLVYLVLVLVPPAETFRLPPGLLGVHTYFLLPHLISGVALLLGGLGFALARRWRR